MYVCVCKGITDTQIRAAVQDGAGSIGDVHKRLGVASQCGKCGILTREIVRESLNNLPSTEQELFYALS
ncbi:MAG: bacterioferritin-associated ferredoxin [Parahaliea sp.]